MHADVLKLADRTKRVKIDVDNLRFLKDTPSHYPPNRRLAQGFETQDEEVVFPGLAFRPKWASGKKGWRSRTFFLVDSRLTREGMPNPEAPGRKTWGLVAFVTLRFSP